jgi:hypothetical protein
VWKRRLVETFAIITLGDGLIEFLAPKEHSRLWVVGPQSTRRLGMWFVEEPERMRVLGAAQVVLGVWLALRQHRDIWSSGGLKGDRHDTTRLRAPYTHPPRHHYPRGRRLRPQILDPTTPSDSIDLSLTLNRTQRPAIPSNRGNKNPLRNAEIASLCNAQKSLTAHS